VQAIRTRIYARAEAADAKLLKLSTSFANMLETIISCFAKLSRITTSFGKLLEMLLTKFLHCLYDTKIKADVKQLK
jgi:hypothetical protein